MLKKDIVITILDDDKEEILRFKNGENEEFCILEPLAPKFRVKNNELREALQAVETFIRENPRNKKEEEKLEQIVEIAPIPDSIPLVFEYKDDE